jgi:hypothetical protein
VKFESIEQNLVNHLVNLLVCRTHRLQIDLVVEGYLRIGQLLVALRQDVIWVLYQLLVQDPHCFRLASVIACLRSCEELRTNSVLLGVELQIGQKFF